MFGKEWPLSGNTVILAVAVSGKTILREMMGVAIVDIIRELFLTVFAIHSKENVI